MMHKYLRVMLVDWHVSWPEMTRVGKREQCKLVITHPLPSAAGYAENHLRRPRRKATTMMSRYHNYPCPLTKPSPTVGPSHQMKSTTMFLTGQLRRLPKRGLGNNARFPSSLTPSRLSPGRYIWFMCLFCRGQKRCLYAPREPTDRPRDVLIVCIHWI